MYEDKTLVCKECGNEFVFTAGEQEFYAEKGFVNEPQRCKACRDARLPQSLKDRLTQQLVLLAAARLLFLSSQERTDLFTVASVSLR